MLILKQLAKYGRMAFKAGILHSLEFQLNVKRMSKKLRGAQCKVEDKLLRNLKKQGKNTAKKAAGRCEVSVKNRRQ